MKLEKLFSMQKELDRFIQTNRQVEQDVFREKGLALLVELSELANETRCFKFWSLKGASEREVILEEYVDSIHFLLSLGIESKLEMLEHWPQPVQPQSLTELFLGTQRAILDFLDEGSMGDYQKVWSWYGALAVALDFSYDEVLGAYVKKNEENYERQREGY